MLYQYQLQPKEIGNFTQDLTGFPNFHAWSYGEVRANGKPAKVPFSANTGNALNGNVKPEDLASFDAAIKSAIKCKHNGVGIYFLADGIRRSDGSLLYALDFDDINQNPQAKAVYERLRPLTYTETSPGGKGGRAFIWGRSGHKRINAKSLGIELYSRDGFVTVTGQATGQSFVAQLEDELNEILEVISPAQPQNISEPISHSFFSLSDDEVFKAAFNAKNGDEVKRVFEGGAPNNTDQSRTGVLMSVLARFAPYCSNTEQLCRIARQSAHYSNRWDEKSGRGKTQLERSAEKAIRTRQWSYDGSQSVAIERREAVQTPVFWYEKEGKDGPELKINRLNFIRFLEHQGFARVWPNDNTSIVVQIHDNIAQEKTSEQVRDHVINFVRGLPKNVTPKFSKDVLENLLISGYSVYFSQANIKHVRTYSKKFHKDTKRAIYVYFRNGYTETTANGTILRPYSSLGGVIWRSQILDREYTPINKEKYDEGIFAKFQKNICSPVEFRGSDISDEQSQKINKRLMSLKSAVGYLMHRYSTPVTICAVIFCDEKITLDLHRGGYGGSGKGLSMQGVQQVRNVSMLDGKNFDPKDRFKYQDLSLETDVVFIDDISKKFDIENLYSQLSNGFWQESKGKDRIKLPQPIKVAITTNYVLTGDTPSDRRRKFEIEVSDYYNDKHTPYQDFKKDLFGDSWSRYDWSTFDNYMLECAQIYLGNGLIKSEHINLKLRKLIAGTCMEFAEFAPEISINEELEKKVIYEQFKEEYPDFNKLTQRTFTKWLYLYAEFKGYMELSKAKGTERRSHGTDYFTFREKPLSPVLEADKKLPQNIHPDDRSWFAGLAASLPGDLKSYAITTYDDTYIKARSMEPNEVKKDNAARYAANTEFKAFVESVEEEKIVQ